MVADDTSLRECARAKILLGIERIEPLKQLYEKIAGTRLPVKSALIDSIKGLGIPDDISEEAVDIFIVNLRYVGLLQVLPGADRVVTIDHLLDNLPSAIVKTPVDSSDLPPSSVAAPPELLRRKDDL
jgi:hypothetical protein